MSTTTPPRPQEPLGKVADEAIGLLLAAMRAFAGALERLADALQESRSSLPAPPTPQRDTRPSADMSEWTPELDTESQEMLDDLKPATTRALSASLNDH